jgi:hypothetical protein
MTSDDFRAHPATPTPRAAALPSITCSEASTRNGCCRARQGRLAVSITLVLDPCSALPPTTEREVARLAVAAEEPLPLERFPDALGDLPCRGEGEAGSHNRIPSTERAFIRPIVSAVTAGSTAPDESFTVHAIALCANADAGNPRKHTRTSNNNLADGTFS